MIRKVDLIEDNSSGLVYTTGGRVLEIAMTKAGFNALAEERKANRAGSGFDSFGWGSNAIPSTDYIISEGMWVRNNISNAIFIARSDSASIGVSKSKTPMVNIAGVQHKIFDNGGDKISLPSSPNIYPHDTVLTAEQIASGVIKHADSSNSGLIVNGKFDTDTSGWTSSTNFPATLSNVNGKLRVTATNNYGRAIQGFSTVVGKKYIVKGEKYLVSGTASVQINLANSFGADATLNVDVAGEFIAQSTTTYIVCALAGSVSAGAVADFDNIAVYPADAISRSDLVFLESWHEDISEKNFVYPLGNVQYLGANTDGLTGIANGSFSGFETYSLFGNFQAPSALIGKGYVWSSLTEAQKKAFISNPENNCYLDGDKVIQVRYRVRVVQGLGDNWLNVNPNTSGNSWLHYSYSTVDLRPKPKGKLVFIQNDINGYSADVSGFYASGYTETYLNESGVFVARSKTNTTFDSTVAYEGKCFALPIALVHRRNQGMYHPVYNPNGSKKASDGNFWYNTAVSFTSISDCFDASKLLTASGYIGTVSGRPDGLFYDQVHESDITDLRNSSKKVEDYNRLISREFNKLVAGTTRGKEGEPLNLPYYTQGTVIRGGTAYGISRYQCGEGSIIGAQSNGYFGSTTLYSSLNGFRFLAYITIDGIRDLYVMCQIPGYSASVTNRAIRKLHETAYYAGSSDLVDIAYIGMIPVKNETNVSSENAGNPLFFGSKSTRTKSNTLLHCDIIGNPSNYPTSWKQSGVFGTPLIVAEDGTSLLPTGTTGSDGLNSWKFGKKLNAQPLLVLKSSDNGSSWSALVSGTHYLVNLVNNNIGFYAPYMIKSTDLVMVYYQTHTSMAVPVVNSEVLKIGDVYADNYYQNTNYIRQSLIGKINTNSTTASPINFSSKLSSYSVVNNTLRSLVYDTPITHSAIELLQTFQPMVKVLPYLTRLNGKAYLNLVFKEMKYNGTSWGDDAKFNIVDNVSTTTDNNAQTVLIGQKTVELPYFIGADE